MNRNRLMPENYAPYRTMPAFDEGITAYMEGRYDNPWFTPQLPKLSSSASRHSGRFDWHIWGSHVMLSIQPRIVHKPYRRLRAARANHISLPRNEIATIFGLLFPNTAQVAADLPWRCNDAPTRTR